MNTQNSANMSASSEQETCEVVLNHFDHYIVACTQRFARHSPYIINMAPLDLEIDELIQRVRVKFWYALERRTISYPYTYIKRIIHSEIIDLKRRQKHLVSFFPYEDLQEPLRIEQICSVAHELDPADAIEQQ